MGNGPPVVMNKTHLHSTPEDDSPVQEGDPLGKKAAKKRATKGSSFKSEYIKCLEEITRKGNLSLEWDWLKI